MYAFSFQENAKGAHGHAATSPAPSPPPSPASETRRRQGMIVDNPNYLVVDSSNYVAFVFEKSKMDVVV
jgi:hypothetical protein